MPEAWILCRVEEAEQVYDVLSNPREFTRRWPEYHKWAMRRGFEGLARELARRAAA